MTQLSLDREAHTSPCDGMFPGILDGGVVWEAFTEFEDELGEGHGEVKANECDRVERPGESKKRINQKLSGTTWDILTFR